MIEESSFLLAGNTSLAFLPVLLHHRGNSCKNRGRFFRGDFTHASNDLLILQTLLDNTPMQSKKSLESLAQLFPL
jgi:hypothetical protein